MLETTQKIKKDITIDQLAEMMMREFAFMRRQINERFDAVDVRFEKLEARVSYIEKTMATKDDISRLEKRLDYFEGRFDRLENVVLKDHTVRITRLERLKIA